MSKVRTIHQFFAGEGGEDKADLPLAFKEGPVGPGRRLQALLGDSADIVVTAYCGDNYFPSHSNQVLASIVEVARARDVGMLVAGPSFGNGRYGFACAEVCHAAGAQAGLPCVTGMHEQNPGVDVYRQYKDRGVYAVPTTDVATGMEDALSKMSVLVGKLATGSAIGSAAAEGYIPRGLRLLEFRSKNGAERAIDLLLSGIAGRHEDTEIPIEKVEPIPVPPRVTNLKAAHLALLSTAGVVPLGNPDRFKANRNTFFRKYSIAGLSSMLDVAWDVMHGGYNTQFMKDNPNFGVPLDICRQFEKEGAFAKLYPYFYSTPGVLALYDDMRAIGIEITQDLKAEGIDAAIMVST
ncbi:MAG: glycine/betaine/sarcosine/D-proline family reductase selenoprotein B [Chloroflexi bacterium]|nr:glycine/betaine/sarcosine/D-proline family reductase selenoprotein B [Chloroflexota bacterium]